MTRHKNHPLKTLRGVLKETSKTAHSQGDEAIVQLCEELQKRLPEFQKPWMAEYEKVKAKRKLMRAEQHNHHLLYANHQLKQKVKSGSGRGFDFGLSYSCVTEGNKETPSKLKKKRNN